MEFYAQHQQSKFQLPSKVDCNNLLTTFHSDPPTSSAFPDGDLIPPIYQHPQQLDL